MIIIFNISRSIAEECRQKINKNSVKVTTFQVLFFAFLKTYIVDSHTDIKKNAQLERIRIIQHNLVFVSGLPEELADANVEDVLFRS